MRMTAFMLAVLICVKTATAYGAGIPVFDGSNLTQNQLAALENIKQTLKQIEEYKKQLEQLKEQLRNGMGLGDMAGQFQDLFDDFGNLELQFNFSNSAANQLTNYQGGGASDNNYYQSGSGTTYFSYQPPPNAPDVDFSIWGDPRDHYERKQGETPPHETAGAELANAVNREAYIEYIIHQERIKKEIEERTQKFEEMKQQANSEGGGTNQILGTTNELLQKMYEQLLMMQLMMTKMGNAQTVEMMNNAARQQQATAQSKKLRLDTPSFQAQKEGRTPLHWTGANAYPETPPQAAGGQ